MEIAKILTADVLDIIFEGKNKSYGAYELRKSYSKRLVLSITLMLTVILLLWVGYLFANDGEKNIEPPIYVSDIILDKVDMPKKIETPPPPPPPPPAQAAAPKMKSLVFNTPVIADVTDMPPTDELDKAKIGPIKRDGGDDDGTIAPPVEGAGKSGIIAEPVANREAVDSIFTKVEIESQYPGGSPAWSRFLNKSVSGRYPQDAIDQGIEGKVVIQFIVDREGNISGIEAVEGPEELRDLAIRTIKKSGKWIPAEQNGNKVKSYKRQPFIFQLPQE